MRNIENVRAARRRWYHKNSKTEKKRIQERMKFLKRWLRDYRKQQICVRCGFGDWRAIVFHHRDPERKETPITSMWKRGWSIEHMKAELDKCDALCANCHMIEHASVV